MTETVAMLMTDAVVTLREEDNLLRLLEGMETLQIRHLPVVDEGMLVGMVSQRDVLRLLRSDLDPASSTRAETEAGRKFVAEVMTREIISVSRDTPIEEAARLIVQHRFGCLPVVDDEGRLLGIVTDIDLLRHFVGVELTQEQHPSSPPVHPVLNEDR